MKKALLFPLFLLSTFAISSCGSSSLPAESSNAEEVNKLKSLLSKQDLSPTLTKMFVSEFTQDYDFFSSAHSGEDRITQFHSYHGGGSFGCAYSIDEASYNEVAKIENHDFFDYLSRGQGGYGLLQSARVASYHEETDHGDHEVKSLQYDNFLQNIQVNFGESDVQVSNYLTYSNAGEGGTPLVQSFNGRLGKEALFDNISIRTLSDLFARTNLYDGQRSCESIDGIYEATLNELNAKTDKELSDFIENNHISFSEEESNTLVHFQLHDEGIRASLTDKDIIPGLMEGTLSYDKNSGLFSGFEYKITHNVNETDAVSGRVYTVSMEFTAKGYSKNEEFEGDIYIAPNPTVYEDGAAFLEDMTEGIIPDIQ